VSFGHPERAEVEAEGKGGENEEKKDGGQEGKEEEKWSEGKEQEEKPEARLEDLEGDRCEGEEFRVSLSSTRVSALSAIEHQQDYEVTCVQLSCSDTGVPRYLYLGTSDGPIKRVAI
jgi:hypothetical protein